MSTLQHPLKSAQQTSVWQLTLRLAVLAGFLMASSYFILMSIGTLLRASGNQ